MKSDRPPLSFLRLLWRNARATLRRSDVDSEDYRTAARVADDARAEALERFGVDIGGERV